jgi:hypothetical protein
VKSIVKKSIEVLRNASIALGGSIEFGSPALFALAVVGLVGYPPKPRSLLDLSHSLALLCLSGVALYFIYYSVLRFYVLFLLFFCIWASAGLLRITFGTYLMLAGDETSRPLLRSLPRAQTIAACLSGGLVVVSSKVVHCATLGRREHGG